MAEAPDAADRGPRLHEARAFMFDIDGTLVHRDGDGRAHPQPRANEVLEAIRHSGRKLVLFTNGSHVPSARIAAGLRDDGLHVTDEEVLTPVDSATAWLNRHPERHPVHAFASDAVAEHMLAAGVPLTAGEDARAVFVAHLQEVALEEVERAARAIAANQAPLFTSSYVRGYAGVNGIIFSRGSMITAAIAKVSGARPRLLGKPSRAAVAALQARLGVPATQIAVIGDDLGMDIALGRMGGSRTVLVRSGISGEIDLDGVPERHRPDGAVDAVAELLPLLQPLPAVSRSRRGSRARRSRR
ncbi:MAG: HAD-IIA family hydrolase [Solirubrobacteraceae bacterium]